MTRCMLRTVSALTLALTLASCASEGPPMMMVDGLGFARRCDATEDCLSGLCLATGAVGAVCTIECTTADDCPDIPNWGCVSPVDQDFRVCGCISDAGRELCGDQLDNDCDGVADDCQVCSDGAVPMNDPANCGRCDNACRGDQGCVEGECVCAGASELECDGVCVDTDTSTEHCGACGSACATGLVCEDGSCECPSTVAPDLCGVSSCVDLDTDEQNCGTCGRACGPDRVCTNGRCGCPYAAAPDYCAATGCLDLDTDEQNCGVCGEVCTVSGAQCMGGDCACPAPTSTVCNGACTDTTSDEQHCNGCGQACASGLLCVDSSCQCPVGSHIVCGGTCVDPQADEQHCGACGQPCGPGETCTAQGCTCTSGLYCGGVCVQPDDATNCGACGNSCAAGQECNGGSCVCELPWLTACGDACVSTSSDVTHCGGCDDPCRASEVCQGSSCICPSNTSWCDGAGCVATLTDEQHCGNCDTICPGNTTCQGGSCVCSGVNEIYCASAGTCVNRYTSTTHCGACDSACDPTEICSFGGCRCPASGALYCTSQDACVDTTANPLHCGACDNACGIGQTCTSGTCRCPTGYTFCAESNACFDLRVSDQHCGRCGNTCASDAMCTTSACVCDTPGLTHCNGECVDRQVDESNCGSCGRSCAMGDVCLAGTCVCPPSTVAAAVTIADSPTHVEVAIDVVKLGSVFGVAWQNQTAGSVHFGTYDAAGTPLSVRHDFGSTADFAGSLDLIATDTEFALAFEQKVLPGTTPVRTRVVRFDASGAVLSDATHSLYALASNMFANSAAIAWSPPTGYAICFGTRRLCGVIGPTAESTPTVISTVPYLWPTIFGAPDGTFRVVMTRESQRVYMQTLDASGALSGPAVERYFFSSSADLFFHEQAFGYFEGNTPVVVVQGVERLNAMSYIDVYVLRGEDLVTSTRVYRSEGQSIGSISDHHGVYGSVDGSVLHLAFGRRTGTSGLASTRLAGRFSVPSATTTPVTVISPMVQLSATTTAREVGAPIAVHNGQGLAGYVSYAGDNEPGVFVQPFMAPTCGP